MKLLKYVLVLIIAISAAGCVDEQVGPLHDEEIPTPPLPPPPNH